MNVRIGRDVIVIVEDEKPVPTYRAVERDSRRREQNAESCIPLCGCGGWRTLRRCFWLRD